jgi:hypothetical protein
MFRAVIYVLAWIHIRNPDLDQQTVTRYATSCYLGVWELILKRKAPGCFKTQVPVKHILRTRLDMTHVSLVALVPESQCHAIGDRTDN